MLAEAQAESDVLLDEQHGEALTADCVEGLQQMLDHRRREPGRWFVDQHELRIGHECAPDGERGLLSTGERARRLGSSFGQHRKRRIGLLESAAVTGPVAATQLVGAHAKVLLDRERPEHLAALRNVTHAESDAALRAEPLDLLAAEPDRAGARGDHAGDDLEQHALAGAVQPEDAGDFTESDVEVDAVDDRLRPEAGDESAHLEQRGRHAGTACPKYASTTSGDAVISAGSPAAISRPASST